MSDRCAESKPRNHGEIAVREFKGYSIYVCADCGQNINNPAPCFVRRQTQPNPPTFDSLLSDPEQQLDPTGVVMRSVVEYQKGATP